MYSKALFSVLCISMALIEVKSAMNYQPSSSYPLPSREYETNETYEEPIQRHHHRHHHHHGGAQAPPPGQDSISALLPLFQILANRVHNKSGRLDASSDNKFESMSKSRAYIVSKWKTNVKEIVVDHKQNNDSKLWNKNLYKSGETDAIIDFDSGLDISSDKRLSAEESEESKPEGRHHRKHHSSEKKNANELNRYKRQTETGEGNGNGAGGEHPVVSKVKEALQNAGKAIAEGFKAVKETAEKQSGQWFKKMGDAVGNALAAVQAKQAQKKAGSAGQGGQEAQPVTAQPTE